MQPRQESDTLHNMCNPECLVIVLLCYFPEYLPHYKGREREISTSSKEKSYVRLHTEFVGLPPTLHRVLSSQ